MGAERKKGLERRRRKERQGREKKKEDRSGMKLEKNGGTDHKSREKGRAVARKGGEGRGRGR